MAIEASTPATGTQVGAIARRSWREAGPSAYTWVVVLWFLSLWSPHKLLQYYIPPLRPLAWIPELLLWYLAIQWMRWPEQKHGYPAYTRFILMMVLGTGVAYVLGNWGIARGTLRVFYQDWLLGLITLTICTTPDRARPILATYFGYFLWFGLWGLISLKTSPMGPDIDPAARVIIAWHTSYDNRDAFGPLMVAGLAYSIYYLQANRAVRTKMQTAWVMLSIALCTLGFLTSFGRGAFLGFLTVAISMWLRSRRKLAIVAGLAAAIGAVSLAAPQFAAKYVANIQSITGEGTKTGTGADRADLWGVAWREFLSSPIVGVGTYNYGAGAARVLSPDEVTAGGYTAARLWGRSVHSAPMEILAEYGLMGVVVTVLLIADFFRTNRRTRIAAARAAESNPEKPQGFPPGYVLNIALGLRAAFLGFLVSSIFYELLYTPLIWNVIVFNRMLYFASGAYREFEKSAEAVAADR
jgi:hypothetical protein